MIAQMKNVSKILGSGKSSVKALNQVDFVLHEGEFVAVVGPSGSGKTTFLNILGGLLTPDKGEVYIRNRNLYQLTSEERTIFRRRNVGFVFQQYNLVSMLNTRDNILLPLQLDGQNEDEQYLDQVLTRLKIKDKQEMFPDELSGGQKQRVALARALMTKPALILADEPTGNLDVSNSLSVVGLLKELSRQYRQSIVMVTHNIELAQLADRIVQVEDGYIK
ncbi:ABC transporter ATP-binding protein [Enterococcus cecorum]|uniref:ABC transporter ATP-binding protein n=1 Tax=Enterococcus cecorum TaxID=44008 RepID=UPI001FAD06F3|nr:ABC transporter ATP-binding protein [Enterococcus cecorum]MCJ0553024.1 ABC transporter ATP-binding protein [Enterococcus cecorum]MCJ0557745.1 ABC transporter ATP-binding protein [Enterococcus cecorum]MCJ0562569.1 ABC transporter ATP-binding protein [Enterococcus cecorum]MCJ0563849.1 ABC transporter ATP-binding protein [Enterococcus cecorum]MCJ0567072.1 ABC transporter ATP-binding protein [Enterococcus cecorum]